MVNWHAGDPLGFLQRCLYEFKEWVMSAHQAMRWNEPHKEKTF